MLTPDKDQRRINKTWSACSIQMCGRSCWPLLPFSFTFCLFRDTVLWVSCKMLWEREES